MGKEFFLTKQKWLSEFKIKINIGVKPKVVEVPIKDNTTKRFYVLDSIINDEPFDLYLNQNSFGTISEYALDISHEGKYHLYVKIRRGKIHDNWYCKPEIKKMLD